MPSWWSQASKAIFLLESSETLAPSDLSAQWWANTTSAFHKPEWLFLCCSPCLVSCRHPLPAEPHSGRAEGIRKLWLTFAIQTTDAVINHPTGPVLNASPQSSRMMGDSSVGVEDKVLTASTGSRAALGPDRPFPWDVLGAVYGSSSELSRLQVHLGQSGSSCCVQLMAGPFWQAQWAAQQDPSCVVLQVGSKDMGTLTPIGSAQRAWTAPAQKEQTRGTRSAQSRPCCMEEQEPGFRQKQMKA